MTRCESDQATANGGWEPAHAFGTDIEGRFLYLGDGRNQWLLAAFDFSYQFRRTTRAFRQAVAQATGIPVDHIWVHDSQSHSAPCAVDLDGEPCRRLIDRCLPVIRQVMVQAREAELAYVLPDLGDRFNMNREQDIPGLGRVTVWTGCMFDAEGRAYTQDPSIMLLEDWKPGLSSFASPIYFDRPADPQAALLVFRDRSGNVLGSLTRFAAHPDIVGACVWNWGRRPMADYRYHFDWPGYVRQRMETHLGGIGLCIVGPCGDLSTKKLGLAGYEAGDRQAREIGHGIADACLAEWGRVSPAWQALTIGQPAHRDLALPLRDTVPARRADLVALPERTRAAERAYQAAIRAGADPHTIKRLIDHYHHFQWMPNIVDRWAGLTEEELAGRVINVEPVALRLNDLVLAGLPGESMRDTAAWLREQTGGNRLISFDLINGYAVYQSTAEQYDRGGYGGTCSCLAREAEAISHRVFRDLVCEAGGDMARKKGGS
jgi:hypothetical protein